MRLHFLWRFGLTPRGNGIVAQALLSISRRSASLHRPGARSALVPLAAADSGPLDPITLRACIQVLGEKQYEHVVQILREDWRITVGETLEGYLLNIKELRKKE